MNGSFTPTGEYQRPGRGRFEIEPRLNPAGLLTFPYLALASGRCRKVCRYLQPHLPDDLARLHSVTKRPAGVHGHLVERLALECLGHDGGLPHNQ